jgi:phenylalanyl-tRNA synthetase beta chain
MKVPLSWLKEFAPFNQDAEVIADTLSDLGLVVESVKHIGDGLDKILVAKVLEIDAIPGADKIRKVIVDTGSGEEQIVCGASNFKVGDHVPLASVGTTLPDGMEISRRKMRGVLSNGMLCSGSELGLSEDQTGLLVLGESAAAGMSLTDALGIEPDTIYDLSIEGNRPDALSLLGVARDLAARTNISLYDKWQDDSLKESSANLHRDGSTLGIYVEVLSPDLCPRFTASVFNDISIGDSPPWLAQRLVLAGMRPINNIVDASNYVMLELGQPTHPYDLSRLAGRTLRIRASMDGESLTTLDDIERVFGARSVGPGDDLRDCLICDGDDVPIGIAGIMGGESTEISGSTADVLLEAASFNPMSIARTSKRLGLRSEASLRFERGGDPGMVAVSIWRFAGILSQSASYAGTVDISNVSEWSKPINISLSKINNLLGTDLNTETVSDTLRRIGFKCQGTEEIEVTPPTYRPDIRREADVAEEVARLIGYSTITPVRPRSPKVGALSSYQRGRRQLREIAAGMGAYESWCSSLVSKSDHSALGFDMPAITVENPLSADESVLRLSLLPGLLKSAVRNIDRRIEGVRLFEVGTIFPYPAGRQADRFSKRVLDEREMIAILFALNDDSGRNAMEALATIADSLGLRPLIDVWQESYSDWAFSASSVRTVAGGDGGDGNAVVGGGAAGMAGSGDAAGVAAGGGAVPGAEAATVVRPEVYSLYGLHPSRSGVVVAGKDRLPIGTVGEVDPLVLNHFSITSATGDSHLRRVGWLQLDLRLLLESNDETPVASPISKYPSADIDLSFETPAGVSSSKISSILRQACSDMVESIRLIDVYKLDGRHSLTFRVRLSALDHTLDEAEIASMRDKCVKQVHDKSGAALRSIQEPSVILG